MCVGEGAVSATMIKVLSLGKEEPAGSAGSYKTQRPWALPQHSMAQPGTSRSQTVDSTNEHISECSEDKEQKTRDTESITHKSSQPARASGRDQGR